jgi:hypothetical protein
MDDWGGAITKLFIFGFAVTVAFVALIVFIAGR